MHGWQVTNEWACEGFGGSPVSTAMAATCWRAQPCALGAATNEWEPVVGAGWDIEAGFLAAVPSSRRNPEAWRGQDFSNDQPGLGFVDTVWTEEGGKPCAWAVEYAQERVAALPHAEPEDPRVLSPLNSPPYSCSPRRLSALGIFTDGDSLLKVEAPQLPTGAPAQRGFHNPLVLCGATMSNLGKWDLMLGEELPSSLLGDRTDTIASLATQSVEVQEDAYPFMGDEDMVGDFNLWGSVYASDNSRLVLPSGEAFLSEASLAGRGHAKNVGKLVENLQVQLVHCMDDLCACDRPEGGCRVNSAMCDGPVNPCSHEELVFSGLGGLDGLEEDRGGRLTSFQKFSSVPSGKEACGFKLSGQRVSEARYDASVASTCERCGKDWYANTGYQDHPEFPSLTSVFGSCTGSNSALQAVHMAERPQLPSLNSLFGTCESRSCASHKLPLLPSLTSVFGSCNGCTEKQKEDCRVDVALNSGNSGCGVPPKWDESPMARETALGGTVDVHTLESLQEVKPRGVQGSRESNCLLLREGAHGDPYFDAEWNLIPMLNDLWGEEAQTAPKRYAATGAKLTDELLKDVPLVPQQHVLTIRNLGEGSYGRVSLGFCPGLGEIAVKWNKADERPGNGLEFQQEAAVLATLRHPNIIELLGLVTRSASEGEVVGLMTEYAPYGTLSAYIRHTRQVLPFSERIFLALQIARGMAFVHACDVVHFDLKPDNVLVQQSDDAFPLLKVADLGLARRKTDGIVRAPGSLRGTLPYMAPELVCDAPFVSEKVDIWAYGCMLHEMVTLEVPYSNMASEDIVIGLMEGWLQPAMPICEPEWEELLQGCLAFAPQCRPSFEELAYQLALLYDACQQDNMQ